MDLTLLMRLRDLGESSRRGMRDRAFPGAMAQLAAMGFAQLQEGGGYLITEQGLGYLDSSHGRQELRKL